MDERKYDAVLFDLLTALIDSWTLWNRIAGSEDAGLKWRRRYLELTYGAGCYKPYESLVATAAADIGLEVGLADALAERWTELESWIEVPSVLDELKGRVALGVVTNCSKRLGRIAAFGVSDGFDVIVTAEEAGYYKPLPEPYEMALARLGTSPERTLFVAGSAVDVPGAAAVGMPVYWHNRMGLPLSEKVAPSVMEASLHRLTELV